MPNSELITVNSTLISTYQIPTYTSKPVKVLCQFILLYTKRSLSKFKTCTLCI